MSGASRLEQMRKECQAFHKQHPEVWDMFVRFTEDRIARGFKNYSAYNIFERIRWETEVGGDAPEQWKINNNFRPFYSRRYMAMHPEHAGFFRTRKQTSGDEPASTLPELGPEDFPYTN